MTWLSHLWFGYCWPSIKGNGPEAILQTIVYAAIAVAVWPPARAWIKREHAVIHTRLDHLHAKVDAVHDHLGVGIDAPELVVHEPSHD